MNKIVKIIYVVIAIVFMIWALTQQANGNAQIWVQVVAVVLFFGLMARLMSKTPTNSNAQMQNPAEREFDAGIKENLMDNAQEEEPQKTEDHAKKRR
ncbi:hypothetical protein ACYSNX_06730 [Myroides sp. LJL115]